VCVCEVGGEWGVVLWGTWGEELKVGGCVQ